MLHGVDDHDDDPKLNCDLIVTPFKTAYAPSSRYHSLLQG